MYNPIIFLFLKLVAAGLNKECEGPKEGESVPNVNDSRGLNEGHFGNSSQATEVPNYRFYCMPCQTHFSMQKDYEIHMSR